MIMRPCIVHSWFSTQGKPDGMKLNIIAMAELAWSLDGVEMRLRPAPRRASSSAITASSWYFAAREQRWLIWPHADAGQHPTAAPHHCCDREGARKSQGWPNKCRLVQDLETPD
jgi:hypothetical protein